MASTIYTIFFEKVNIRDIKEGCSLDDVRVVITERQRDDIYYQIAEINVGQPEPLAKNVVHWLAERLWSGDEVVFCGSSSVSLNLSGETCEGDYNFVESYLIKIAYEALS